MINNFFVFQRNLIKMGEENILNLNWNNFGDNLSSLVKELICQQEFLEFYGIERNKFGGGLICGYFCWKQCSLFNKPWCADKTKNVHALLPFFSLTPPPPLSCKKKLARSYQLFLSQYLFLAKVELKFSQ